MCGETYLLLISPFQFSLPSAISATCLDSANVIEIVKDMLTRRSRQTKQTSNEDPNTSRMKTIDDTTTGVGRHPLHHHHTHRSPLGSKRTSTKKRWCIGISVVVIIGLVLIAVCVCAYFRLQFRKKEIKDLHAYMKNLVDQVNSSPTSRWKAKFNPFGMKNKEYNHKTLKNITAVKEYVGYIEDFFKSQKMQQHLTEIDTYPEGQLPRMFDSREKWPLCSSLHHVPNQGGCGSCYAVSSITVASDRSCIHSNGTFRGILSIEDVLGCCKVCGNCYGGDPLKALAYWAREGVVTGAKDGCRPYTVSKECGTPCLPDEYPHGEQKRQCVRECQPIYYKNSYAEDKHFGSLAYTLYPRKMTVDQAGKEKVMMPSIIGHFNKTSTKPLNLEQIRTIIKKELFLYGPTTMAFPVTEEFLHYESGIFHPVPEADFEKRIIYWHVVRLIGWGHDSQDRLYWLAINSFGEQWGDNGLFRIDTTLFERFGLEYETGLP
ncbi:Cathepsin B [Aphelenchoides besseyi]|nr:Cathepsin B [Aphelenchoides besseyi]